MAKFKVREHFNVLRNEKVYEAGDVIEMSEEEAQRFAHQVEPVVAAKPAKTKAND